MVFVICVVYWRCLRYWLCGLGPLLLRSLFVVLVWAFWYGGVTASREAAVPLFHITPEALGLFTAYIKSHDVARQHEERCSGIRDIASRPAEYFAIELCEADHADVVAALRRSGGVFNATLMQRWIDENYRANYIEQHRGCD